MPVSWHDHHAANLMPDDKREFYHELVADRKPYFMRYIYPALMRQYNTYIKNSKKKAVREFSMSVDELESTPTKDRTERENEFLHYYYKHFPVGYGDCVMNRICRRFEEEFDGYLLKQKPDVAFDYTIMKSGQSFTRTQVQKLSDAYNTFSRRNKDYVVYQKFERVDEYEAITHYEELRQNFIRTCSIICSNKYVLCDILLDMCYKRNNTKKMVWDLCGNEIIANLLRRSGGTISFPIKDDDGTIEYGGERFSICETVLEDFDWG